MVTGGPGWGTATELRPGLCAVAPRTQCSHWFCLLSKRTKDVSWSIISWGLTCGRWTESEHFPAVSLASSEREALTSEHISPHNSHVSPSFQSPCPSLVILCQRRLILKNYSLICDNSVPGKRRVAIAYSLVGAGWGGQRLPWEPRGVPDPARQREECRLGNSQESFPEEVMDGP